MKVLLSIKPEFVEKIFAGTKKYEFRKALFKRDDVTKVVIYASSPIKRVVGEFTIESILSDDVNTIWEQTKKDSGITKDFYNSYFDKKQRANAIKIGHLTKYEKARFLSDYNINQAPQSFCYILE
ncbi:MAG: ASCH domain-containing protein [Bacteroidaceae bacterium]|nr:ASCH domain-containing protein [Bacteroidaceae bacterium]